MRKDLMNIIVCPACKAELNWSVSLESNDTIIQAQANCTQCRRTYPVENEIADFLVGGPDDIDPWQKDESILSGIKDEIKEALLSANLNKLNSVDLYYLGELYREAGKYKIADKLKKLENSKKYPPAYINAMQLQFNAIKPDREYNGFLLDIATGRGTLYKLLRKYYPNHIICSDVSKRILTELKTNLSELGLCDNVSFVAMNAERMPLRNNSIALITSYLGIGHIRNSHAFACEISRIMQGEFRSIEILYPEKKGVNGDYIKKHRMECNLYYSYIQKLFQDENLCVDLLCDKNVPLQKVETGTIIKSKLLDLPLITTEVVIGTLLIRKKGGGMCCSD